MTTNPTRRAYTSDTASSHDGPVPPEAVRTLIQMWAQHQAGRTWTEIGRSLRMGGESEIAFNKLIDRALRAHQDEVCAVDTAYLQHWQDCEDCDGPGGRKEGPPGERVGPWNGKEF